MVGINKHCIITPESFIDDWKREYGVNIKSPYKIDTVFLIIVQLHGD